MRFINYICILLFLSLYSCNKMNPANFWEDFDSDNIVSTEGGFQGRYGYKIVHFKREMGTYKISNILSFAQKNEWNLYSTRDYIKEYLISWEENDKLLFKPEITGFKPIENVDGFVKFFPRYINKILQYMNLILMAWY